MRLGYMPSDHQFVVCPSVSGKARQDLTQLGDAETLTPDLLLVRAPHPSRDAKRAWRALLARAPEVEWAAPVLLDEAGEPHYPTGDVTVRFDHTPSDDELATFAHRHGLDRCRRNEFVATQMSCSPADARGTYLPELVSTLSDAPGVIAAWPGTRSRYRRL